MTPRGVMAGLVPAIHVFDACTDFKTWMPAMSATSASITVQDVTPGAAAGSEFT